MRRKTSVPNANADNQFVLKVMDSFISYFEKIADLAGDGMLRVTGKQTTLRDFENVVFTQNATLLAEKDNVTPLNLGDLYDTNKTSDLYGNKFISSTPQVSIQCRVKPDALAKQYGITEPNINYRQLILLNNIFFEAGMDIMTSNPNVAHATLGNLFASALKGIDFSQMGMAEKGEYQPDQQFLAALRERRNELAAPAVRHKEKPDKAHSAPPGISVESEKPRRKFSFFKKSVSSQREVESFDATVDELQRKVDGLKKEIAMKDKEVKNPKLPEQLRKESREIMEILQEQFRKTGKELALKKLELQQKGVSSPEPGKK